MKKIICDEHVYSLICNEGNFFKSSHIKLFKSASNEETMQIHKTEKADLIVSCLDTPGMSAEKLCTLIRDNEDLCNVSIIIVCPENTSDEMRISQCRASAFIRAPLQLPILIDKTQQLLHIAKREFFMAPFGAKVKDKYDGKPFLCFSINISASGMLFYTDKTLDEGEILFCAFILPDQTHIDTKAEIVRTDKKGKEHMANLYAMKYIDLLPDGRLAIEKFIEGRAQH
jgi:CheY-like chemotaxis protein